MSAHRLLFNDLLARLRWRMIPLIGLMSLVGLGEGMTVAFLLPLLSRIGVAIPGKQDLANRLLENGLAFVGARTLWQILGLVVAIAMLQGVCYIALSWWMNRLARRYQHEREMELFRGFMSARWNFVLERKAGDLTSTIVNECERLGTAFTMILSLISTAVVTIIYLGISLLIAWQATLCLALFGIVTALAMVRLYRLGYGAGSMVAPLKAELQSQLVEQFAAFKLVKATASEERAVARIEPLLEKLEWIQALNGFLPMMVRGALEVMAFVGLALIIVLAGSGLGVSVGSVLVVIALSARQFPRITAMQAYLHFLNGYVHAIETINQSMSDAKAEEELHEAFAVSLTVHPPTSLVLRGLSVSFGARKVLDQIDLRIPVPGLTALVGASGAGKSTLVHSLLGLMEPSAGAINLGPHEMHTVPLRSWRRLIGYVPQETMLFHASVRDNLTLARPDAPLSDIETAARRAHAYDFITALPDGCDTIIGDQGAKLSGGQRQRLGIARALLTNPVLLVMDEAMSALDSESEKEVLRTLEELRKTMGIVLIAHRLGAVRTADTIGVLEGGRLIESGTWAELMAREARLFAFATAQLAGDVKPVKAAI
jgi:ATP-binding cassette subfamily C protein